MGNLIGSAADRAQVAKTRSSSTGRILQILCAAFIILLVIPSVVVLSLIALYLPRAGDDASLSGIRQARVFDLSFAINSQNSLSGAAFNLNSLAQQLNDKLQLGPSVLGVRQAGVNAVGKRRKRQNSAGLSCDSNSNSTQGSQGLRLNIEVFINRCPGEPCLSLKRFREVQSIINIRIKLIFGSQPISITLVTTDGGVFSVTILLCSSGSGGGTTDTTSTTANASTTAISSTTQSFTTASPVTLSSTTTPPTTQLSTAVPSVTQSSAATVSVTSFSTTAAAATVSSTTVESFSDTEPPDTTLPELFTTG